MPEAADNPARVIVGAHGSRGTDALLGLACAAGCRVVGAATTPRDLLDVASSLMSELVLLDAIGWSSIELLSFAEEIKIATALPLIVVSEALERVTARNSRAAGIDAVLLLPLSAAQLGASIEFVLGATSGGTTGRSGTYAVTAVLGPDGVPELSAREREVFALLARGYRPGEISRELFISEHTVRKHAKLIFRKLGVHSQVELMRRHFRRVETPER